MTLVKLAFIFAAFGIAQPSQFALIRHYKEQHFAQMPPGIFGDIVFFNCELCGFQFKRAAHLNAHLGSLNHIEKMAQNGIYSFHSFKAFIY